MNTLRFLPLLVLLSACIGTRLPDGAVLSHPTGDELVLLTIHRPHSHKLKYWIGPHRIASEIILERRPAPSDGMSENGLRSWFRTHPHAVIDWRNGGDDPITEYPDDRTMRRIKALAKRYGVDMQVLSTLYHKFNFHD